MCDNTHIPIRYNDYTQSSNSLFHFMKELEYLSAILLKKAIVPRYCIESIEYLDVHIGGESYNEVAVLQKCFCDIPLHKITEGFVLNGTGDVFNSLTDDVKKSLEKKYTHPDFYGTYAIAFSKGWGEEKNLQPIHYLNKDSNYTV